MLELIITRPPSEEEITEQAKRDQLARLMGRAAIPPGASVEFVRTVPETGTEPIVTAIIRQPAGDFNLPA